MPIINGPNGNAGENNHYRTLLDHQRANCNRYGYQKLVDGRGSGGNNKEIQIDYKVAVDCEFKPVRKDRLCSRVGEF